MATKTGFKAYNTNNTKSREEFVPALMSGIPILAQIKNSHRYRFKNTKCNLPPKDRINEQKQHKVYSREPHTMQENCNKFDQRQNYIQEVSTSHETYISKQSLQCRGTKSRQNSTLQALIEVQFAEICQAGQTKHVNHAGNRKVTYFV